MAPSSRTPSTWLGSYSDPLPIRARGSFHLASAKRLDDDRPCVVVCPGPAADVEKVGRALADVERAHERIDHPVIPRVTRRGLFQGRPFLELACDAVVDGIEALRALGESERKVPYEAADAFLTSTREALQAAHKAVDPATGHPLCLGAMTYGNILFSPNGRWWLIGFGRNFPAEKDSAVPDGSTVLFQAPEVSAGAPPSPTADYVALLVFGRTLLPYIEMAPPIARMLRGEIQPSDTELIACLLWFEQRMIGEAPSQRPTIEEGAAVSARIRDILGRPLDPDAFARLIAEVVEAEHGPFGSATHPNEPNGTLVVGPDATWVAHEDRQRVRLSGAHRRIVLGLARRRIAGAEAGMTVWEVLEEGWPGERPAPELGANRVYVAMTRLRAGPLRGILERLDDGYRLSPGVIVRFAANGAGDSPPSSRRATR